MALTQLKTGAIADDAVTTDKLANAINTERTANTAKVSLEDNAVTLAKMAGGTDGQIITYDASGDPVAVGPGTDGQVLTSTGAGSPPAFESIPASGKILQVVSTSTTNQFSTTSNSLTDCTPMTVNITPSATSSKVLILVNMTVGGTADNRAGIALQRGTTDIFQGADSSSRQGVTTGTPTSEDNSVYNVAFQYLDSPSSTSELTYHIQVSAQTAGSETFYLNRSGNQSDDQRTKETASSITVMEVAG